MSAYTREELMVLEAAVGIVQRQAVVTDTRMHAERSSVTWTFEVQDMRYMGGVISREEALEQLMEWCGREIATLRAPKESCSQCGAEVLGYHRCEVAQ